MISFKKYIFVSAGKVTKKKSNDLKNRQKSEQKPLFTKKNTYFFSFFAKNWDNRKIFCNFALEMEKYLQLHNNLLDLSHPRVMAIVNVSADSFYTSYTTSDEEGFLSRVEEMIRAGADILDIGACSTRPNSTPVSSEAEWQSLSRALQMIRAHWADIPISVDTFRAHIADLALQHGADMINDVYGGEADTCMWEVVKRYNVPYVLTHSHAIADTTSGQYDSTLSQTLDYLQGRLSYLHRSGVKDVVVDPGFGFGKTLEQNYALLRQLEVLHVLHAPILVGVSRKSMLYKPLQTTPQDVLPATTAAHMIALQKGANILRVHDVEAARQAIMVYELTYQTSK